MNKLLILILCVLSYSCSEAPKPTKMDVAEPVPTVPIINFGVTQYFQHDINLFTEGLLVHDGQLFESSGAPQELPQAQSVIGINDLSTGKFEQKIAIDSKKYFGEGIVILNDKIYQLTYKNQVGFIYDAKSYKQIGKFSYANAEGWSLTTNGTDLIMSDGTANLTYLNPDGLQPIKTLEVTENGLPLEHVNELEYIKGFIYANVWMTNFIVKIDPITGKVLGKLDLSSLAFEAQSKNPNADVLNGIAYDSIADKIYVTGKLWPNIYQISFAH
jgi:glutamine cyclotransferase